MKSYLRVLADIKEKYDIDVVLGEDLAAKELRYSEVKATVARDYVESFLHQELLVYSAETLRKSKLERIVICEKLASCGSKANGMAEMKKLIVPGRKNTIYLNIGNERDNLHRGTVHHEIFHAIDYSDDYWGYVDYEWEKLNPKGFEYGHDGYDHFEHYESDAPGFLSGYGTTAVHEDKAEYFKHLMINYSGVEKRASTDALVKMKVERLKALLRKFSPQFNEDFWEKRRPLSGPVYWL
ncbi:MAG: hypothetical protein C0469_17725 [Cyanobacteria bacterium DS2.3.42]|nr:hypothetical protein [Cyanobacteria bacterium DS2.3.42]